jgi:hypothetical protein
MELYYRIDSCPKSTLVIIGLWEDRDIGRGVAGGTGGKAPLYMAFLQTLGLAAKYIYEMENANRMMEGEFHERKF